MTPYSTNQLEKIQKRNCINVCMTYCNKFEWEIMITDKYTKTAWTIIAIGLFVISEIGFKTFQSSGSKGHAYMRNKKIEHWNEKKNHWFPSRRIWALGSRFVMWSFKAFQARSSVATKRMGYIASRSKNLYRVWIGLQYLWESWCWIEGKNEENIYFINGLA